MRNRKGFTLVEVMMALVILAVVIVGMASATGQFIRQVARSDIEVAAIQMADDRIQTVLMDPNYAAIDTAYAGSETNFPGLNGLTRVTQITRVGGSGQSQDHKRIVVIVNGPGLASPIKRSATVAAP